MPDDDLSLALVRRAVRTSQPGWFHTFSAMFCALLLISVIQFIAMRAYFIVSVNQTLRELQELNSQKH